MLLGLSLETDAGAFNSTVTATAQYTGPLPISYTFYWDDGLSSGGNSSSAMISGTHSYADFGSYAVTLVVTSPVGCVIGTSDALYVGPTKPYLKKTIWYDRVCAGWGQRYDLDIDNTSATTLTNLLLRDFLPPGTRFGNTNNADGRSTGGVFDPLNREVRWNIGDVPPGGHVRVNLTIYVNSTRPVGAINLVPDFLAYPRSGCDCRQAWSRCAA